MKINRGLNRRPRRTMLYGVHGIGKSTWASQAKDHLFANIEDGLGDVDCTSSDPITTYEKWIELLNWLNSEKPGFRWLVIDTADWLEKIFKKEIERQKDTTFDEIPYGGGVKMIEPMVRHTQSLLDYLRRSQGLNVCFLAHCEIKKFSPPGGGSYDRYVPKMLPVMSGIMQEWCDEVFFARYKVLTTTEDMGFNRTRNIVVDEGEQERLLQTCETASALAKNRLGMPQTIGFDFNVYQQWIDAPVDRATVPMTEETTGDIEGKVVDGSSKAAQAASANSVNFE